jgi:putative Mn2+ efflux pump MntP
MIKTNLQNDEDEQENRLNKSSMSIQKQGSICDGEKQIHQKEKQFNIPPRNIPWKIYISRALSAWGDRIWAFAVGIFMYKLAPENLRVVAIYGFVISISVIIFGAMIGNWIDENKRLFAAKVFLSIQNLSVAIACIVILGHYLIWNEMVGT